MGIIKKVVSWGLPIEVNTDREIELYVDAVPDEPLRDGVLRIILMEEPISPAREFVNTQTDQYSHVLTYEKETLDNISKAVYFRAINPWVKTRDNYDKKFCVSTVVGWKNNPLLKGYSIRHELWRRQNEIKIPRDFYLSKGYFPDGREDDGAQRLGDSKEPLFDNQFHVAIENVAMYNYFSEKLIDCFVSNTIPIYYGTFNIDKYFNVDGIYIVRSVSDIIRACNSLTPETYQGKINAIKENKEIALSYNGYTDKLRETIENLL